MQQGRLTGDIYEILSKEKVKWENSASPERPVTKGGRTIFIQTKHKMF